MVTTNELTEMKREPTSVNVDPELWREVRKTAIDLGETASEFFDKALRDRLAKVKREMKEKHFPKGGT